MILSLRLIAITISSYSFFHNFLFFIYGFSCAGTGTLKVEYMNSAHIISHEHAHGRHPQTVNNEQNEFARHYY